MKQTKSWQQLLLIWVWITTLLVNSASVALAQEPSADQTPAQSQEQAATGSQKVYLPLVSAQDNGMANATASNTQQIIIHYKNPAAMQMQAQAAQTEILGQAAGVSLTYVRQLADESLVLRLPEPLSENALQPILARIAGLPEVAVAEPDAQLFAQVVPNDRRYGEQWHYFPPTTRNYGANLPGAWDITTGAANQVVAVLDSGELNHEDLMGRTVPGYDFITDLFFAFDGDERDPDPTDTGDWGCGRVSSWHGTHVAGTIAANSNNGLGVTGINWNTRIQHLRVLGVCGVGATSDIADAIRWAAGLSVPGAPLNPTPARVLNLSLGGLQPCATTMQNAINAAVNAGAIIVVAAGNNGDNPFSSGNVAYFTPANCDHVIPVSATDRSGDKARYSNYGARVKIAAPGGETDLLENRDGVLSTLNSGETVPVADTYSFYQGTSMAAPHISGIVSLMLAVKPSLTLTQIVSILQTTATGFPAGSECLTYGCGAGIVNAAAAVAQAQGGLTPPGNLQVTTVSSAQVNLRWLDKTSDETGFKVERCQGAGCANFVALATLGVNSTSYVNSGVVANTSYSYRIRATKNGVDSAPSNIATTSTAVTAGCTIYHNTDTVRAIPDYDTLVSTVTAANQGTVTDVNLRNLKIEHIFDADLSVVLVSPAGTQVELFNAVGGAGANFSSTMLDDEAVTPITDGSAPFSGSYRPSNPLSLLDGQGSTGVWTLRISDNVGGYEGWLYGWSLEVCGSSSSNDLIFEDGFEAGSFGRWTSTSTLDGGDLSVSASAARIGTRGMSVFFDDTVSLYVTDDTPAAEARYRTRFTFDPNTLLLPNGLSHYTFYGYQGTSTVMLYLEFRNYNGVYQLRVALRRDNSTWQASSWYAISDDPHSLELDWRAATAPGANNGGLTFWIDGVQKAALTGTDNDTLRVDRIRLGAVAGLDAGTVGSYYFDAFKSTRQNPIGPALALTDELEGDVASPVPDPAGNVVEEDLSLDDVGVEPEEGQPDEEEAAASRQIFLPLISQ